MTDRLLETFGKHYRSIPDTFLHRSMFKSILQGVQKRKPPSWERGCDLPVRPLPGGVWSIFGQNQLVSVDFGRLGSFNCKTLCWSGGSGDRERPRLNTLVHSFEVKNCQESIYNVFRTFWAIYLCFRGRIRRKPWLYKNEGQNIPFKKIIAT